MPKKKEVVTQKEKALYILVDYTVGQDRYVVCREKDDLVKELQEELVVGYGEDVDPFIHWLENDTDILKIENGQVSNVRDDLLKSIESETKIKINY